MVDLFSEVLSIEFFVCYVHISTYFYSRRAEALYICENVYYVEVITISKRLCMQKSNTPRNSQMFLVLFNFVYDIARCSVVF